MGRMWRGLVACASALAAFGAVVHAQTSAATEQFVPVSPGDLQQERIPAARLVFIAYGFVWLVFVAYLFILWRRMQRLDADVRALNAKLEKPGR